MDKHRKVLLRSILSLVSVLAIGGGVTYALFTSNTVTVGQSQMTTGGADLRICNSLNSNPVGSNTWKDSISPTIDFSAVNPGDTDIDVTLGHEMYLGNDDGTLEDAVGGGICSGYDGAITPGNSTVPLNMIPTISNIVCTGGSDLENQLSLRFNLGGSFTGYKTLTGWSTNTTDYLPDFLTGEAKMFSMQAKLPSAYALQDATCTFDTNFQGEQA
ncbi:hypothetical protein HYW32_03580 [Candidatus Berkelbacteria bacterium]|nr:hypothetical protein [Candidatus Berkelbacteria bacterium]